MPRGPTSVERRTDSPEEGPAKVGPRPDSPREAAMADGPLAENATIAEDRALPRKAHWAWTAALEGKNGWKSGQ